MTMTLLFANNASSRLFMTVSAVDTSIRVEAGHGVRFPQPAGDGSNSFTVTVEDRRTGQVEIMTCTSRSGDIMTVVRAQEGTTAQAFAQYASVSNRLTAATMDALMHAGGQGPQGPVGATGPAGPQGAKGDTGADSTVPGPAGPQGDVGPQGTQGDQGDVGPQGPVGNTGPVGPQGPQGELGPVGATGPASFPDAPDAQNYARTLGSWLRAYSKAEMDTLLGGKADTSVMTTADNLRVLKAGDTMTGLLVNNVGIQAGTNVKQSNALISAVALGNNIEFGHPNTGGYHSNLGCDAGSGGPFLIFNGEAGTTNNTYRTRGIKASVFKSDSSGGFSWGNVANANADNQAFVSQMSLSDVGVLNLLSTLTFSGGGGGTIYSTNNTSSVQVSGGSGTSVGASLVFFGAAHASQASRAYYDANIHSWRDEDAGGVVMTFSPASGGTLLINSVNSSNGQQFGGSNGGIISGRSVSTIAQQMGFQNPSGVAGTITTTNLTTNYGATSDENFKELNAEMDPAEAIRIIRADPVLSFNWKATGDEAIGWFAQKSYAVDQNLAVPPEIKEGEAAAKPGEDGYVPWGIDYGKRTPYLWAALTNVLDRLEALEAKLSITDPKPPRKKAA
jgi:hypothetical protein